MEQTVDGRTRYKILLIANTDGLPSVAREVAAIASVHDVNILWSPVTEADVAREAGVGGYDIIWFAAHSNGRCVYIGKNLTDNIGGDALVAYVAASGAGLCVLNVCESVGLARQVIQGTTAHVVFTVADPTEAAGVTDTDAMRTGKLFAGQLAIRSDYREAYERSKPGNNRIYLFLDNDRGHHMASQSNTARVGLPDDTQSLVTTQLNRIEFQLTAIREEQTRNAVAMATMGGRLDRLEQNSKEDRGHLPVPPPQNWPLLGVLLLLCALTALALIIVSLR